MKTKRRSRGVVYNLNHAAKRVTDAEGGKVNLSIGQVKEVIRIYNADMRDEMNRRGIDGVIDVLNAIWRSKP